MRFDFCKQGMMITILLLSPILYAKNLGVVGQVYPIQEEDFLQFILNRLHTLQETGVWKKLQNQLRDHLQSYAERPDPVRHITKAVVTRSWDNDPSITAPYDLRDATGQIFANAGTTINPLHYVTIHHALIFFDGDDVSQVKWVDSINQKWAGKTKLILVNGSLLDQSRHFHQAIYFDQAGTLTTRFSIQHVPAVITQEGLHLKITEVAI